MDHKKETNFKTLYISLIIVTFLMMGAMYLFQNYYK